MLTVSGTGSELMIKKRDKLFQVDSVEEDFVFNDRVVEVFDDMLDRSVPYYSDVISASAKLLSAYLEDGDRIYDLGCSTGTTLIELCRLMQDKKLTFIGVDNSSAMLEKAKLKAELHTKSDVVSFLEQDITRLATTSIHDAGAFLLNYTLQFIRPLKREEFLEQIYQTLRPGGVLLLSEKIISHDSRLNREYIDIYHNFKKKRGYSELEIAKKREALENILIPFSIEENKTMLEDIGFTPVQTYFQWFNFTSFIAVKPS